MAISRTGNRSCHQIGQGRVGQHSVKYDDKIIKKFCISNVLDGSEDDVIFESDEIETDHESEDEATDYYGDNERMTSEQFHELFDDSDTDSDFEGF